MNTPFLPALTSNAFASGLSADEIRSRAPAVFATAAHARMSARYTMIHTDRVLAGLMEAGFRHVDAQQVRSKSSVHGRHLIRFRRAYETVQLRDAVPEVVFLNSHDGTSAYQLRLGIFRVVCTNGLIVSKGAFPAFKIAHRRDVVDEVIAAALQLSGRFDSLAEVIQRMEARQLQPMDQRALAEQALSLRFGSLDEARIPASDLLVPHRAEDVGDDLWRTFNRVQENLLRGGQRRRALSGRLMRVRRITSIKEDVRLNSALWELGERFLAAA
jgi:Domain of unknown function (DUF932)